MRVAALDGSAIGPYCAPNGVMGVDAQLLQPTKPCFLPTIRVACGVNVIELCAGVYLV